MKKLKRILSLALAACLLLSCAACGGEGEARAASMWLVKTEGTVSVTDGEGGDVSLLDRLGLFSGYGVATQAASFGWIDLDDTKLTKMDENSGVTVQKDGKHLELTVDRGSLFFNVTRPLGNDESFEIRSSTMVTAIRGTCGWVEVPDPDHMNVYILEGTVECSVGDVTESVTAGEKAFLSRVDGEGAIVKAAFDRTNVPDFVAVEAAGDGDLKNAILDASGVDVSALRYGVEVTPFAQRFEYQDFTALPPETQELLRSTAAAISAHDDGTLEELLTFENLAPCKVEGWSDNQIVFYTEFDSQKLRVELTQILYTDGSAPEEHLERVVEYRPKNGPGCFYYDEDWYHIDASLNRTGYYAGWLVWGDCLCVDWQFEGDAVLSFLRYPIYSNTVAHSGALKGRIVHNLREGAWTFEGDPDSSLSGIFNGNSDDTYEKGVGTVGTPYEGAAYGIRPLVWEKAAMYW